MAVGNTHRFTCKELSELNKLHNAHISYEGKVYNISSFISSHPGGVDQLMMGAGRDITPIIHSYHKEETIKVLEKYYVGELIDNEMPLFTKRSDFYFVLKKRVRNAFKAKNIDPKVDYWWFSVYITFIIILFTCWYSMILFRSYLLLSVLSAVGWGIMTGLIGFTLAHDSGHYAITHSPWVWRITSAVAEHLTALSMYCWGYQHTYGHHCYTNIDHSDPDVFTSNEKSDLRKIKQSQVWLPRYLYQHIYMPVLYSLAAIKMKLQDFHTMYILKKGTIRMNPPSNLQLTVFFSSKLFHLLMKCIPILYMDILYVYRYQLFLKDVTDIVISVLIMSFLVIIASLIAFMILIIIERIRNQKILLNLVYEISIGLWFAVFTQLNHISTQVSWPEPNEKNEIHSDWAEIQVASTKDYCTDSRFWTLITGALNHQVAHHLFPGVLQCHYRHITPIVRETCKEFGIPYYCDETFSGALYGHLKFMFIMGRKQK